LNSVRSRFVAIAIGALVVVAALLPTTTAAAAPVVTFGASWKYTAFNHAVWNTQVFGGSAAGTLDETAGARVFTGSVTSAADCVTMHVTGVDSGGTITQMACGGTINFAFSTSSETLVVTVEGPKNSTSSFLYAPALYPSMQLPGVESSWKYTDTTHFTFKLVAYGFVAIGSGQDVSAATRTVTATLTADGLGGCSKLTVLAHNQGQNEGTACVNAPVTVTKTTVYHDADMFVLVRQTGVPVFWNVPIHRSNL